ncbi:hypothetical protein WJ0W_005704, partial [Paenibacillus melissococcoides]
ATARGDVNRMKKLKRQVDKMVADLKEEVQRCVSGWVHSKLTLSVRRWRPLRVIDAGSRS